MDKKQMQFWREFILKTWINLTGDKLTGRWNNIKMEEEQFETDMEQVDIEDG